jgi:serine protease Do
LYRARLTAAGLVRARGAGKLPRMVARNSPWVSVLAGLGCVALGTLLGVVWSGRQAAPIFVPAAPPAAQPAPPSFADVAQRVADSVVTVRALRSDETTAAGPRAHTGDERAVEEVAQPPTQGSRAGIRRGSGFVCSPRGLVLTSRHVVAGALDIDVVLADGKALHAEVVGEDAAADLALLRLADPPADLRAVPIAAGDELRAGDWIVAVGNPFGYAQTVTAGVVSFVGRHLQHSDFKVTNDFLQISAPVNPGSSGCPVFDLQGRVVGVTTQALADAQGISFAVPGHTVAWALAEMLRSPDGRVRRGYLGIEFATCTGNASGTLPRRGAIITQVVEGQPAHRAGVRAGDVVVRVDDVPVPDAKTLHERIVCSRPGTALALHVLRGGQPDAEDSIVAVLGEVGHTNGTPN